MSFLNDIILRLGLSPEDCAGGDRVSLFDGKCALIEGHRGIYAYTDEQIVIKLRRGKVTIDGAALRIIELNPSELYISGRAIYAVKRD